MTSKPIVVGVDGSAASLQAVDWAAREAVLHGAPLRIVAAAELPRRMVSRSGPADYETVTSAILGERDRALTAAAEQAARAGDVLLIDHDPLDGPPAQAVTESGSGALMLVVGSRGAGAFAAMLLGSVSRYAASHASCPVIVIRDEAPIPHGLIGVGVSDPDDCADALGFAFEEASLRQAGLLAIYAWQTPQTAVSRAGQSFAGPTAEALASHAGAQLTRLLDEWRIKYPAVPLTQEVVHGHPARALAGLSARADLVVLGRHARHPGIQDLGAVRHAVLNHAHGPVAVIPTS
jgi:nucleotide-binding universal stress UspA family protein